MKISASQIIASLKDLREEYYDLLKNRLGEPYPVFRNASPREMMKELGPTIRFSADDKTKSVYAWKWDDELHPYFRRTAGLDCPAENKFMFWCDNILEGVAEARGGKYILFQSDGIEGRIMKTQSLDKKQMFAKKILVRDWTWVDKYIEVTPYLNILRRRVGFQA